jgi:hypothetical protein
MVRELAVELCDIVCLATGSEEQNAPAYPFTPQALVL